MLTYLTLLCSIGSFVVSVLVFMEVKKTSKALASVQEVFSNMPKGFNVAEVQIT